MSDWRDDLAQEDTIFQIFRKSPNIFNKKSHVVYVLLAALALLFITITLETTRWLGIITWSEVTVLVYAVSNHGFYFGVGILGFLIAGFAIFATITNPDLLGMLAQMDHDDYPELSELKFLFFTFLNVFLHFIFFVALTWLLASAFQECGPVVRGCRADSERVNRGYLAFVAYPALVVVGVHSTVLILKLKSFIWNLYQTVIITIIHAHKDHDG